MKFIIKTLILLGFVLMISNGLIFQSCNKKDAYPNIPNVYVNLYLDLTSTQYVELNSVGGYVYLTGGHRGILVYRISVEDFIAFERTCPYDPDKDCARIEVEPSGLTTVDSCCLSRFLILDGSVLRGPSTLPLKQYRTSFDGSILRIYN